MTEGEPTAETSGQGAHSVVVICTKDRPDDIRNSCFAAHAALSGIPILVVDASTTDATRQVCENLVREHGSSMRLMHHWARRSGLARQRNDAVELCRELGVDIVHFIDDDTEVEHGYFDAIEHRFSQDVSVVGVGGIIINQPVIDYLAIRSFFLLRSRRRGTMLRSGRNMLGQYPGTRATDNVEWLNGCSMSYRMTAFDAASFDDRLEGPSLGEDYRFSFQLSRRYKLAVEPGARCIHHVTPAVRGSRRATARESIENTYWWVVENGDLGMSLPAFWWATLGDVLLHTASWVAYHKSDSLDELRGIRDALTTIIRARKHTPPIGSA